MRALFMLLPLFAFTLAACEPMRLGGASARHDWERINYEDLARAKGKKKEEEGI